MTVTQHPAPRKTLGDIVTPRRVVLSLLLALAAGLMLYAVTEADTEAVAVCEGPPGVEAVQPCEGDLDLRQGDILVDLETGYTGVLQVDGVEIPDDQLVRTEALQQLRYTPSPDTETGALEPGRHCARVVFWKVSESRDQAVSHSWCFTVH